MSKQYNKILKRRRRQRYIKRKKLAAKLARQAKTSQTVASAQGASAPGTAAVSTASASPAQGQPENLGPAGS